DKPNSKRASAWKSNYNNDSPLKDRRRKPSASATKGKDNSDSPAKDRRRKIADKPKSKRDSVWRIKKERPWKRNAVDFKPRGGNSRNPGKATCFPRVLNSTFGIYMTINGLRLKAQYVSESPWEMRRNTCFRQAAT
ncbi:MAG: hypothetical protein JJU29_12660, partial [Verrucomicrobia bacterium]|nr:hypothetical protein [Verrucomicrobiota bacterium]